EIASVTPVTTQLGIDFRTYQRLIKLYPSFHKEIDKVVGFQIFSLKPEEFLNSYRKRTCVSEGIRQAIELYLQTIIIRKMHFSREYHSTVAAREFGVDKGTVRRLKQKYPTFSSIIKILKNYNELKETYLPKHSGISYTTTEKNHNISNILSLISNFYDLTKIYAISYHIKNLKKINHKEYKTLLDFVYSLKYNIDWHSQISYSSDLNSSESFYIYRLTQFIDKIGPTNFSYKRYRITLLIYLMLARFEND
ncbi:hypothetical protein J7J90_01735, partial [Candidatus Micrarchaeota archaeon]|nr:hypothetical protein [Candidatus Micrarchaeota archaeon]